MTRPDGFGGTPTTGAARQFPGNTAPYPPFPPPHPGPASPPPYQPYQPHPPYSGAWGPAGPQFSTGPLPQGPVAADQRRRGRPSTGRTVAFLVIGIVLLGLIGGGLSLITSSSSAPDDPATTADTSGLTPPIELAPATPTVTVSLPPVIDGHQQIDNQYAQQLADSLRQPLLAGASDGAVVGLYGELGEPTPAFLIAASTTDVDPELILTGVAAGMQQSAGATEITFVDQPPGPLGGTMRCAENGTLFTVCLWGVEGAFGINIVYGQDLAQSAATTVRVRQAVETHAS